MLKLNRLLRSRVTDEEIFFMKPSSGQSSHRGRLRFSPGSARQSGRTFPRLRFRKVRLVASAPSRFHGKHPFLGKVAFLFPGKVAFLFPGKVAFLFPGKVAILFLGKVAILFLGKVSFLFQGQVAFLFPGKVTFRVAVSERLKPRLPWMCDHK